MKRLFVPSLAVGALLLLPGSLCAQDVKEKAMEVFVKQKCTQCHSIAGRGNKKGALDDVGKKLAPADIKAWIVDPAGMAKKTTPPPTRKPVMKKKDLADKDVEALVAYLSTLKG
jgi:mono/diheme cytochrome c family protein